ncbi:MAG: hypothetical protein Kow0075_05330 [Salibacteraceae bacterium]
MRQYLIIIFLVIVIAPMRLLAQEQSEKPKYGKLYLSGKVVDERRRGLSSTVYVYRGKELINTVTTSRIGKFSIDVPMMDSIAFVVYSEGYVSKTIVVSTYVHPKRADSDYAFPFFIDLYPVGRTPSHIDLDRPVGKISFMGGQFVYDADFTKQANEELKEYVKERKNLRVREIEEEK